ncbi:beta-1,3-galactosyltransferase 1-like [Amblyomma americanum]
MNFKLLFLLGESGDEVLQRRLLEEHKIHGDILQGQFADSYENLTYKTVMLVRWASTFCGEAEFVMKIDDDVLLSVWDLAVALKRLRGVNRTMWGRLYHGFKPIRERTSKWYVSKENYAPDIYPDFLSGTGYLISADCIPFLAKATYDQPFYILEDVYLTGFIGERMKIRRASEQGFFSKRMPYQKPCDIPRIVTSHKWTPTQLRIAWKKAVSRLNLRLCEGIREK